MAFCTTKASILFQGRSPNNKKDGGSLIEHPSNTNDLINKVFFK
jgi:hypothetical protein